jgi:hypothetical protein
MKKYITICILLVLAFVNAQISPPENNSEKLKGNVKSIEIIKYSAVEYFGVLKKDTIHKTIFINYDNKNNVINWKKISNRRGEETGEIIYTDKINFKERKSIENNTEIYIYQWKYDGNGNIIEYNKIRGDSILRKQTAIYNKDNKIIDYKEYESTGKLAWKKTWKYDLKGSLIEFENFNRSGYYSKDKFKYINGILAETLNYDENDIKVSKTTHYYHKNAKIKEEIEEYFDTEYTSKVISNYNQQGKIISKKEYNKENNIIRQFTYQYDNMGNLILDSSKYGKEISLYDNKGNLIKSDHYYYKDDLSQEKDELTRVITTFEYDLIGNKIKEVSSYFYNNSLIEEDEKSVEDIIITYR